MTLPNFIEVYEDSIPTELCDNIIDTFEYTKKLNCTKPRQELDNSLKVNKDTEVLFKGNIDDYILYSSTSKYMEEFVSCAWFAYTKYAEKYGVLSSLGRHDFYNDLKVQKTMPTQGYHIWHPEVGNRASGSRLLLVIGYLNDVEEGGETEFLYQSLRVKPKKGTIIICPTGFTHTHRGNPPLNSSKYIINGWIEFSE